MDIHKLYGALNKKVGQIVTGFELKYPQGYVQLHRFIVIAGECDPS